MEEVIFGGNWMKDTLVIPILCPKKKKHVQPVVALHLPFLYESKIVSELKAFKKYVGWVEWNRHI